MKYVITIIIILAVLFGVQLIINKTKDSSEVTSLSSESVSSTTEATNTKKSMNESQGSALKVEDVVVGTGATATAGKKVTVHYTGKFTNGKVFDSSVTRGQPFSFNLGAGQVIAGWDQGVEGMKVGGKRVLTVPPELGYGMNDYSSIPGGSTLIFDVELLGVE